MSERLATVLLVDTSSGRLGAAMEAYAQSPLVGRILVASGSDFVKYNSPNKPVEIFGNVKPSDIEILIDLASMKKVDLVDVLSETPIAAGLTNGLREQGTVTLGPSRGAGQLEWDKRYARMFMRRNNIPHPGFLSFRQAEVATAYLSKMPEDAPFVVKAAGLAEGKGVFVAGSVAEAIAGVERVVALPNCAGRIFLLEERVGGPNAREFSGYYLGSYYHGIQRFTDLGFARDYKPVGDDDTGDNTGGMGAVSFEGIIDKSLQERIRQEIIEPTAKGLKAMNRPYKGVLYLGGMYDPDTKQLWVIEYNSRWGDPEAEVILPNIGSNNDIFELSRRAAAGGQYMDYWDTPVISDAKARISVAGCSRGYPGDYTAVKGRRIEGLSQVLSLGEVKVYGAGIIIEDGNFFAAGGRIFHIVAEGDTVKVAREKAYAAMSRIHIPGDRPGDDLLYYRTDIGQKEAASGH